MLFLFVILLIVLQLVQATNSDCNLTSTDWTTIYTALGQLYYYEALGPNTSCNATFPNSLIARYGSCDLTLQTILVNQDLQPNCTSFLESQLYSGSDQTTGDVDAIAVEICSQSFGSIINNYLCNPLNTVGCPTEKSIFQFAIFDSCYGSMLWNLTTAQQKQYFATGQDVACMVRQGVCYSFVKWENCPVYINQIFEFIAAETYTCAREFPTVEYRCAETFSQAFRQYCPFPTVFQKNIYTILITCIVGPFLLVLSYLLYRRFYRPYHISKNEIILQAQEVDVADDNYSTKMFHPELAAVVASKYKGVSFNPQTGEWIVSGKKEKFSTEKEAARFAYINLQNLVPIGTTRSPKVAIGSSTVSDTSYSTVHQMKSNDHIVSYDSESIEYVVDAPPPSPEQIKQRRLQQLIAFYEFWDSDRPDIAEHAENLLNRHDFEHISRALLAKYGVLPPGWAEELEV